MKKLSSILISFVMVLFILTSNLYAEIPETPQKFSKKEQIEFYKKEMKQFKKNIPGYKKTYVVIFISKDEFEKKGLIWPFIPEMGMFFGKLNKEDFHHYFLLCFDLNGVFHKTKYCFGCGSINYIRNGKSLNDFINYVRSRITQILNGADI